MIQSIKTGLATMIDKCSEPAWKEYQNYISQANEEFINIINFVYKDISQSKIDHFIQVCSTSNNDHKTIKTLSNEVKNDIEAAALTISDPEIKNKMTKTAYSMTDGYIQSGRTVCEILFENSNSYTAPVVAAFNALSRYLECGKDAIGNQLKVDLIIKAAKLAAANLIGKSVWANFKLVYQLISTTYNKQLSMAKLGELFAEHTYTILHPLATKKLMKKHK